MSSSQMAVFKTFQNAEVAKELHNILTDAGFETELVDNSAAIDITFTGNAVQEVQILLNREDFTRASEWLQQQAATQLNTIPSDHYLRELDNDELFEVLIKPDEWTEEAVLIAKGLLKERGKQVDEDLIKALRKKRIDDLTKVEPDQKAWIYTGYILVLLWGIPGVAIGWYMWNTTKTLPDGTKAYAFSTKNRKQGRNLFWFGSILTLGWLIGYILLATSFL